MRGRARKRATHWPQRYPTPLCRIMWCCVQGRCCHGGVSMLDFMAGIMRKNACIGLVARRTLYLFGSPPVYHVHSPLGYHVHSPSGYHHVHLPSDYHAHLPSTSLAMEVHMPLPLELVLNIITCSLPAAPDALLDTSYPTTQLLIAFTIVCHGTRRLASRYLRQHCVYLDTTRRLEAYLNVVPSQPALSQITSLSLATSDRDHSDLHVCTLVSNLLTSVSGTLRKLVVDMPLWSCLPPPHHLDVLRSGFDRLVNLEEITSIQCELFLGSPVDHDEDKGSVWTRWPRLTRMAFGNAMLAQEFWRQLSLHPSIQTLVVAGTKLFTECDPKAEYLSHTSRPLRVIVIDHNHWRVEDCAEYKWNSDWEAADSAHMMTISKRLLSFPPDSEDANYGQAGRHTLIKSAAEDGTLWALTGEDTPQLDNGRYRERALPGNDKARQGGT
jgi:hypothetical protein